MLIKMFSNTCNSVLNGILWTMFVGVLSFIPYTLIVVVSTLDTTFNLQPNDIFSLRNIALISFTLTSATWIEFFFSEYKTDNNLFHLIFYGTFIVSLLLASFIIYHTEFSYDGSKDLDLRNINFTCCITIVITFLYSTIVRTIIFYTK